MYVCAFCGSKIKKYPCDLCLHREPLPDPLPLRKAKHTTISKLHTKMLDNLKSKNNLFF